MLTERKWAVVRKGELGEYFDVNTIAGNDILAKLKADADSKKMPARVALYPRLRVVPIEIRELDCNNEKENKCQTT